MNIETAVIPIPGLRRTYTFFHTSDFHLPPQTPEASAIGQPGADEKRVIAPEAALNEVLNLAKQADGVFLCGDLFDAHDPALIADIKQRVASSGVRMMAVCGNHERIAKGRTTDISLLSDDYAPLMNGSTACWVQDFSDFLVIGIDNGAMQITSAQLQCLHGQAARGKPILLLMHMPMKTAQILAPVQARWGEDAEGYFLIGKPQDDPVTREFYDFVRSSQSHVEAVFAGHIHLSHISEFAPRRSQYTSAAAYMGVVRQVTLIPARA